MRSYTIKINGIVQGVGFRPHVARQARRYGICGWVKNTSGGVLINAGAQGAELDAFVRALSAAAPPAAVIDTLEVQSIPYQPVAAPDLAEFSILDSIDDCVDVTGVCHDLAVCADCLTDLQEQPHRQLYGLINCVNCGPRFSIIRSVPYDRPFTSMADFELCPICRKEYEDIIDRRYHAQPIACNHCGPSYTLYEGNRSQTGMALILKRMATIIEKGGIIAVKGMGGYHLVCDALQEAAVARLRQLKTRESKPLAVMFRDIPAIRAHAYVNAAEAHLLADVRRPIVLLRLHSPLTPGVTRGLNTIGAMLPGMPLHYLLFEHLPGAALVATSGNLSGKPLIADDRQARRVFGGCTDAIVAYNRKIVNRCDDSVAMVRNGKTRLLRRARGYVPDVLNMDVNCEGIVAVGAELVNCFCVGKGTQAIMSQHIGDLQNMPTLSFFSESLARFEHLFRLTPTLLAADLHPDYLSTRLAEEYDQPCLRIQHHHAHIAAAMAEHHLYAKVIGVALDGNGYGTDGHVWGGEFLVCDRQHFERVTHLAYMAAPGGDLVVKEPWRMALAWLAAIGETDGARWPRALQQAAGAKAVPVLHMLARGINAPLTSSTGRLFDAVAALTGVCTVAYFHAEAPMRLESLADAAETAVYPFTFNDTLDFRNTIEAIYCDLRTGVPVPAIAMRFHNTLALAIRVAVQYLHRHTGLKQVVLSGGVLQNRLLSDRLETLLTNAGFEVFSPCRFPPGDGGLALGQLAIAAQRRCASCV